MGKAQSKRSVDITTDVKKGAEEEVTEKLEKIEDVDQKQVNGDASPQEINEAEKKDTKEAENDKDLTTEKSAESNAESGDQNITTTSEAPKDGANKEGGDGAEEITPLADESIKKSKKEKVKKKWSFRNISFGKKDKQKPAKNEETSETAPITNGDGENADASKAEKNCEDSAAGAVKPTESPENGNATEKELNGQKTPTPTEEKLTEPVLKETTTATATAVAAIANASAAVSNETAIENNQTENKATAAMTNVVEKVEVTCKPEAEKNGIESPITINEAPIATDKMASTVTEVSAVVESTKTIPSGVNDGHEGDTTYQNGTNGEPEVEAPEQMKSQIEVNTDTDTTTEANLITTNTHTITTTITITTTNSPEPTTTTVQPKNQFEEPEEIVAEAIVAVDSETPIKVAADDKKCLEDESRVASIQCESESQLQPPPLPVSPPPSQVSVFAFNNDNTENVPQEIVIPPQATPISAAHQSLSEKSVDDIAELKASEIKCSSNMDEIVVVVESIISKSPYVMESKIESNKSYDEEENALLVKVDDSAEKKVIEIEDNTIHEIGEADDNKDVDIKEKFALSPLASNLLDTVNKLEKVSEMISEMLPEHCKDDLSINTENNIEEVAAAVQVVDEVTEKALEIVAQKEDEINPKTPEDIENVVKNEVGDDLGEEQPIKSEINSSMLAQVELEQNGNTINVGDHEERPTIVELVEKEIDILSTLNDNSNIHLCHENENANETEYGDSASLIKKKIENLTLNDDGGDSLTTTTKNIVNAKDLKENAAAEIITQEVSVTNE